MGGLDTLGELAVRAGVDERKSSLEFEVAGRTDIGMVRRSNQDAFEVVEAVGLAAICDGMGGVAGGEVASRVALESFIDVAQRELDASRCTDQERTRRALCRAAAAANRAVRARASYDTRFRGMGTTLVAARLDGNEVTVVNVGDSRAYMVRGGVARQISRDHSYVAEQVRMGRMTQREAESSPMQSAITRAIGIEDDVSPDFYFETVEAGDGLLLCSDGLIRHVKDEEIGKVVADAAVSVDEVCERLIGMANERGGVDNVTCVVMRFSERVSEAAS